MTANSPDFIAQLTADGRILYVNHGGMMPLPDVIGTTMYDWLPPETHARFAAALGRVFADRQREHIESLVVVSGLDQMPYYVFDVSPVVIDDRVESAVLNARNTSKEQRAARRLRELESELAHALRMSTMGEMVAVIAHELHQPLAAVVNYAGACAELVRSNGRHSPQLAAYLDQIERQTLRAGNIIRRVRGFIGKKSPDPAPLAITDVIAGTAPLLEGEARHRGIELEVALADALPPVLGDQIQLQQVIVNLVKNALEAASHGGAGKRRVRIEADVPRRGDIVEVRVSDTGPGLSTEALERAFEPFFSTKRAGMGFGLSISRSIAEAHGGALVLRETSSAGAVFCLALPTHNPQEEVPT